LTRWNGRYLSFASRVCLIMFILTIIHLCYLSFFKTQPQVCQEITRIQRNFMWGWNFGGRKIAWVKWENLCKPKENRGLGIKDITLFNMVAKWKWKWRIGKRLCKEVLESKYGIWRKLNEGGRPRYESKWWRDLRDVCWKEQWFDENDP